MPVSDILSIFHDISISIVGWQIDDPDDLMERCYANEMTTQSGTAVFVVRQKLKLSYARTRDWS